MKQVEKTIPTDMQLFLLVGQSNMAGRGKVEPQDEVTHPRIFMLTKDCEWVPAKDPVHYDRAHAGVGLCSSFARVLADNDPTVTIGLIPCAVGATALHEWMPGGDDLSLYGNTVSRTREAMKSGTLAGILWHQGEAESDKPELAATYVERFTEMIAQLRRDLDAETVPVVVGELGYRGDANSNMNKVIRSLPDRVPNCVWVSAKGLWTDGHFNSAAYRTLGERYAEAYLTIRPC